MSIPSILFRFIREPPFRLLGRLAVSSLPFSYRTKAFWDAVDRPHYLTGLFAAADQGAKHGAKEISAFEFGVAQGAGLLALQAHAERVERETGVRIRVFGFDTGEGLPSFTGDYRDHPDLWRPGQYRMDVERLQKALTSRTELVLGNIAETIPKFLERDDIPPAGFVSIDVDLYSSTSVALELLGSRQRRMLPNVAMYFDDLTFFNNHRYAGEFLAIEEFNERHDEVKIDRWYGIKTYRPFQDPAWLNQMFVAHDLRAITALYRDERGRSSE
ncbi:MAG: hypothetical protein H6509_15930 [Bryobacterales bacterium]|nr:hypothetical protein [Acidobacteriota bacterium]MCB9386100.1 hypothetical protein [Bryobacterales bacterium]